MRQGPRSLSASLCLSLVGVIAFVGRAAAEPPAEAPSAAEPAKAPPEAASPKAREADCKLSLAVDGAIVLESTEKKTLRLASVPSVPRAVTPLVLPPVLGAEGERQPYVSDAWQRSAGLVVGGAGVVGLGVAGAFFADALHKRAEAAKACPPAGPCEPKARQSLDARAAESGNIAAIAAVSGLALAGMGAVLYLTAPAPSGLKDLKFSPTFASGVGGGISAKASF